MTSFVQCNFNNPEHTGAFASLLNHYMEDPMGDHEPHDAEKQLRLIEALENHPTAEVFFVLQDGVYVGMATTFVNLSTFYIRPYLYIHDVVVKHEFRGKGFGKALIKKLIEVSVERGYCKLTLEVREDNPGAQHVYRSLGFEECNPKMYFWTKMI